MGENGLHSLSAFITKYGQKPIDNWFLTIFVVQAQIRIVVQAATTILCN